jgi:hypothetical protein
MSFRIQPEISSDSSTDVQDARPVSVQQPARESSLIASSSANPKEPGSIEPAFPSPMNLDAQSRYVVSFLSELKASV